MSLGLYIRSMPQDPLQRSIFPDPCLSGLNCGPSTKSMSQDPPQDPCLRTLYKIHVSGSMSQHLSSISHRPDLQGLYKVHGAGSSTRSMSPDPCPCLRIYTSQALTVSPLQDPRSMSPEPRVSIHTCEPGTRSMSLDACLSIHISVDSRPDEPKSAWRYSESLSANRKPAPRHNETQQNGVPTTPARQPPITKSQKRTDFQPHLNVSLPIRNAKRNFLGTRFAQTPFCGSAQRERSDHDPPANLTQTSPLLLP